MLFGALPDELAPDGAPSVISLDIRCESLSRLRPFITAANFTSREVDGALILSDVTRLGGILLSFQEIPKT